MVVIGRGHNASRRSIQNSSCHVRAVSGVGVEQDADGTPVVVIHTDPRAAAHLADLPSELEGVPVRIVEDVPFRKQGRGAGEAAEQFIGRYIDQSTLHRAPCPCLGRLAAKRGR